ncbi:hypothetical protein [Pontibacter litorisediminis]|uniref:hypothetical protein n=1 Tax=Pontibacter litorisediminis TaxID=1846260 RepID=UPI0023ED2708|nr:hypothetical protein [Pontibacter litorisediminis]
MEFTEQQQHTGANIDESSLSKSGKAATAKRKELPAFKLEQDLPWVQVAPDAPYFMTETGEDWTPIGQNDAITWPDFAGLFRRKNLQQVEGHLAWLAAHGVTCLRLMLEYAQGQHRYFEKPAGTFNPSMVQLWDDLFRLCAKYNIRILLTPVDTFWMWIKWKHHPYSHLNGGPCKDRSEWLLCPDTLRAVKNRLSFVAERWGGSGVLFAWDLWNEIHPAHAGDRTEVFADFVQELSQHLRQEEQRLYGRCHPQTVSLYGPVLDEHPAVADVIFRHPMLDFASTHFYDAATINNPKDTLWSAIVAGRLVREALEHLQGNRPFFDSEHGPIHAFKDRHIIFPEYFDDEYFRHIQWAHLASGAAGGGMRWPNRHPHCLTHGMRRAQKSMAAFVKLLDWKNFRRKNLNYEAKVSSPSFVLFACADERQALLWLLRADNYVQGEDVLATIDRGAEPLAAEVQVPGMNQGAYRVTYWDTLEGKIVTSEVVRHTSGAYLLLHLPPVATDVAVAVRPEQV